MKNVAIAVAFAVLATSFGCEKSASKTKSKRDADASSSEGARPKHEKAAGSASSAAPRSAQVDGAEDAAERDHDGTEEVAEEARDVPAPDGAGSPAETAASSDCAAACQRRKACGITEEPAACATGCASIRPAFGGTLDNYAGGECSRVQAEEPLYQNALRCAKGCERRVECLKVTDRDACVSDCSMAGLTPAHLDEYGAAACEWITEKEPAHQELRQMIHTCKRLLECGVPGTMQGCLQLAKNNLAGGVYGVDKLASLEKESCDELKKTAYIEPPAGAPGSSGGASGGGGQRWAPGWFGSWTDTHGNKVYHRPPGPGVF